MLRMTRSSPLAVLTKKLKRIRLILHMAQMTTDVRQLTPAYLLLILHGDW